MTSKKFFEEFNNLVCEIDAASSDILGLAVPDTDSKTQRKCLQMLKDVRDKMQATFEALSDFPDIIDFED